MSKAYNQKIEALKAEYKDGSTKIPKNAGIILYKFLKAHNITPDEEWYHRFYRQVVMGDDSWPMHLPIAYVMEEYVRALKRGQVIPESNDPSDHHEAFREWIFEEVDGEIRRDLMFMKYDGTVESIGEWEGGSSAIPSLRRTPTTEDKAEQSTLRVDGGGSATMLEPELE